MAIFTRTIVTFILSICLSITALAEKRVALVVGNSKYELGPLNNPMNDADDLTGALKRLHFDVTERKDLTIRAFDDALDDFVKQSKDADIAMFFFSGHGVQIDKRGYLVPVDFKIETESRALRQLFAIQEVVSRIERAAKVTMVVLDACRDSPLQEHMRRIMIEKNRGTGAARGLPPISVVGSNTLVVYATVAGETASDGPDSRNSPFTAALLKNIETPNVDVEVMFKHVTADVLQHTSGKQQPERQSRLQSELILLKDTAEQQLWDSVKDSTNSDLIETYLVKYPKGTFADVARALIKQIEQQRLLDQAVKEEEKRQAEAERKEAEVRTLEENLEARETALAEENRRIEQARAKQQREQSHEATEKAAATQATEEQLKLDDAKLLVEKLQAEELKHSEELRQAKKEARIAKEAAATAEKQRQETEKAAAEARRKTTTAALESGKQNEARPDPLAYSSHVWAGGSIRDGELVSTVTNYGRLVCVGGNYNRGKPRVCHWN